MTKREQFTALENATEELSTYVCALSWNGDLTEEEAQELDHILEKINKVAEEIHHEANSLAYVYAVYEECHGIIGYHKTFEGAKKRLIEYGDGVYRELAGNHPLDYDSEIRWGWDVLCIERIKVEE